MALRAASTSRRRRGSSLVGLLYELYAAEKELGRAYQAAYQLHLQGALSEEARQRLHAQRDAVYALELAMYSALSEVLPTVVASQIPEPTRTPDLPPRDGPALARELSAIQVVLIWAGVVLLVLLAAIWVWGIVSSVEVAGDTAEEFYRVREDTRRYALELEEAARRYRDCIRRGGSAEDCARFAPVPQPATSPRPPSRPWWVTALMVVGGAALLGGGVWVWAVYRKGRQLEGLEPFPKPRSTRGLSGTETRRALAGGYQMEV